VRILYLADDGITAGHEDIGACFSVSSLLGHVWPRMVDNSNDFEHDSNKLVPAHLCTCRCRHLTRLAVDKLEIRGELEQGVVEEVAQLFFGDVVHGDVPAQGQHSLFVAHVFETLHQNLQLLDAVEAVTCSC
jgi:hypothetical protein